METLAWLLAKKVPAAPKLDHSFESYKPTNCVSDEAMESSRENDKRERPKRRRHVFPSRSEELDLARRAKDGDARARDKLLCRPLAPCSWIAKRHVTESHAMEDLIQVGFEGLIRCFAQFDPEPGDRFSTFAMRPVEWAIKDYKKQNRRLGSARRVDLPGTPSIQQVGRTTTKQRLPAHRARFATPSPG